jgi:hypothetical protein
VAAFAADRYGDTAALGVVVENVRTPLRAWMALERDCCMARDRALWTARNKKIYITLEKARSKMESW